MRASSLFLIRGPTRLLSSRVSWWAGALSKHIVMVYSLLNGWWFIIDETDVTEHPPWFSDTNLPSHQMNWSEVVQSVRSCQGRRTLKAYPLTPWKKIVWKSLADFPLRGRGVPTISAKVFLTVREWTNAQRAFLLENKIQVADFTQIHAKYALR